MSDIKAIIKSEFIKCSQDPVHFLSKYAFVQHPQRGRILFNLYPFQAKVIKLWAQNDYCIINKSRQLGISTLAAGYALWLMLFQKDKNILCIATKQETARNMVTKVKFMFNNLPTWLKVQVEEDNKLSLRLSNGSIIKATSAATDAGRSEAVSLLIIDEAAFIENVDQIWASSQQTLSTGGKALVISTPYGTGNFFHKTFSAAEIQANEFVAIKLPWYVHPERNEAWRRKQDDLLGDPRMAAQECDAEFNTSGDTVFYPEWLEFIKETQLKEPLERRGINKNLWIWETPDYSRDYMVVADVARGDGKDYSGAHVIDIESNTQVAEFRDQLPPKEYGYFLVGLASEYNNALLVVENANIGWATLDAIIERGYRNLYYSPKSEQFTADAYLQHYEQSSAQTPGFTVSLRNRPLLINKFREYVGDRSVTIRSKRLYEEMKVFIWKYGRPEAQTGYNDDLVMPFAIGMYLRDTSLRFQQHGLDQTRKTLDHLSVNRTTYSGAYGRDNSIPNPYSMKINGRDENIKWLI